MGKKENIGILLALFSVVVWASTYISTKILVQSFDPLEISLVRFSIGLLALTLMAPPWKLKIRNRTSELRIAAAGILGMFLYYFLENLAAQHTYASNISIIVTAIPLWTSLLGPAFDQKERFSIKFIWAFLLAMGGMVVLIFGSGKTESSLSLAGDLAALGASVVFALYTVVLRGIDPSIPPLHVTRKSVQYGWVVILLVCLITGKVPNPTAEAAASSWPHFLFLGIAASAICFVTWAMAVRRIGAVRSSQFIYLVPFVTVSLSALILKETITPAKALGLIAIVSGVLVSQGQIGRNKTRPKKDKVRTQRVSGISNR